MKYGTASDDVYKSKWPYYYLLLFLNDNLQPRKTFLNLSVFDDDECAPSPASFASSETNNKRPKPKRKVFDDHYSEEVQFKRYTTDYMRKMTEQADKETKRATKKYFKLQIHQLVLKTEFGTQQPSLQSPPPQNVFRTFGNPDNFHSSTPHNSATRGQPSTLDAPPPRNTDNTYIHRAGIMSNS